MTDRTPWGRRKYLVLKDIETVNEIERLTIREREIQEDDRGERERDRKRNREQKGKEGGQREREIK